MPTADPTAHAEKQAMRERVLAARARLGRQDLEPAAAALARAGVEALHGRPLIAGYLAAGTEPPTRPLLDALAAAGTRVLVPVVDGDRLDWAEYLPDCPTATGPLGVEEPTGERLGADAFAGADAALVPALAVDALGNRLGRGRGYYDRTLAAYRGNAIAVVYDDELLPAVPSEAHDRRVQAVLRPAGYLLL